MEKRLMQCSTMRNNSFTKSAEKAVLLSGVLLLFWIAGCGSGTTASTPPALPAAPQQGPQTYFAPFVANTTFGAVSLLGPETYTMDDSADKFSQTFYEVTPPVGPQVISAGGFTSSSRGLLSLGATVTYSSAGSGSPYVPTTPAMPEPGFAVEL